MKNLLVPLLVMAGSYGAVYWQRKRYEQLRREVIASTAAVIEEEFPRK